MTRSAEPASVAAREENSRIDLIEVGAPVLHPGVSSCFVLALPVARDVPSRSSWSARPVRPGWPPSSCADCVKTAGPRRQDDRHAPGARRAASFTERGRATPCAVVGAARDRRGDGPAADDRRQRLLRALVGGPITSVARYEHEFKRRWACVLLPRRLRAPPANLLGLELRMTRGPRGALAGRRFAKRTRSRIAPRKEGDQRFEGYTITVRSLPRGGSGAQLFVAEPSGGRSATSSRGQRASSAPARVVIKHVSRSRKARRCPQMMRESNRALRGRP